MSVSRSRAHRFVSRDARSMTVSRSRKSGAWPHRFAIPQGEIVAAVGITAPLMRLPARVVACAAAEAKTAARAISAPLES